MIRSSLKFQIQHPEVQHHFLLKISNDINCYYGLYSNIIPVQSEWKDVAMKFNLFTRLTERHPINKEIYESLHRGSQKESVVSPKNEFALLSIGGVDVLEGQRKYSWIE